MATTVGQPEDCESPFIPQTMAQIGKEVQLLQGRTQPKINSVTALTAVPIVNNFRSYKNWLKIRSLRKINI